MMEEFCQSCGMPISEESYGTNADGSKNHEYCKYCFLDGEFTDNCTLEEMIDQCVPFMMKEHPEKEERDIRKQLEEYFPTLARWAKS